MGNIVVFPVIGGNLSITVTMVLPPRMHESAAVVSALEM